MGGIYAQDPPEVQSIKSMLHIVRILAIIFGILLALGGIAYAAIIATAASACGSLGVGAYCGGALGFLLIPAIIIIIFGVVDVLIYIQMKGIEALVDQRQYEAAKSKTLIWMIIGFILGAILPGILLLIAYLKFDPVITWSRQMSGQMPPPGGYAPPPPGMAPPPQAPMPPQPPMSQAPAAAPICPRCGQPATFVAQYGRYYCYTDKQYL